MRMWITQAKELLIKTLEPVRQELNELDWKIDLSSKEERIHHLSAFANYPGGGFLVFGIRKDGGGEKRIAQWFFDFCSSKKK